MSGALDSLVYTFLLRDYVLLVSHIGGNLELVIVIITIIIRIT